MKIENMEQLLKLAREEAEIEQNFIDTEFDPDDWQNIEYSDLPFGDIIQLLDKGQLRTKPETIRLYKYNNNEGTCWQEGGWAEDKFKMGPWVEGVLMEWSEL